MSSTGLLSLIVNGSSRGRSLANRSNLSPGLSFFPRSASSSLDKHKTCNAQESTKLIKVGHLLNIKVKQNYFFAFCKIEQNAKNKKSSQKPIIESSSKITQYSPIKQHSQIS